jgi:hypothetical protein
MNPKAMPKKLRVNLKGKTEILIICWFTDSYFSILAAQPPPGAK